MTFSVDELKSLTDSLIREMQRNTGEVVLLRKEQQQVLQEHKALRRANRRERRWRWISVALIFGAIATVYLTNRAANHQTTKVSEQQTTDLKCVGNYEGAQHDRQVALLPKSNARSKALRQMVDAQFKALTYARTAHPDTSRLIRMVDDWNRKTEAFRRADDAYNKAVTANPIPEQVFTCSDRLKGAKGARVTSEPGPTVTATSTMHVVVPGPTASVTTTPSTVQVPGPTRTVVVRLPGSTRTRTVTTTNAPPDCLTHPMPPCVVRLPSLPGVGN